MLRRGRLTVGKQTIDREVGEAVGEGVSYVTMAIKNLLKGDATIKLKIPDNIPEEEVRRIIDEGLRSGQIESVAELPMDAVSQGQRREAMGLNIDTWHGTAPSWRSAETPDIKEATEGGGKIRGFYSTKTRGYANRYTKEGGEYKGAVYPLKTGGRMASDADVDAIWKPGMSDADMTNELQAKGFCHIACLL